MLESKSILVITLLGTCALSIELPTGNKLLTLPMYSGWR